MIRIEVGDLSLFKMVIMNADTDALTCRSTYN